MPYPTRPRLHFPTDLTPLSAPLHTPTQTSPHILLIGAGVTSLTTAWILLDRGYHVTVLSSAYPTFTSSQRITSQIAGALWELPPGGCGPQATKSDLANAREYALESYAVYQDMLKYPGLAHAFGLRMMPLCLFANQRFDEDVVKREKMEFIRTDVTMTGFARGRELIERNRDVYAHDSPVVDSDRAMAFLMNLVRAKGARMETGTVEGSLRDQEGRLLREYGADVIVNATGLGARELAGDDTVFPVRGAVLRIINDGSDFPVITSSMIFSTDSDENGNFRDVVFMVPRNDKILILGSIVQKGETELNLTPESQEVRDMLQRGAEFAPDLKKARLDPEYPIAQGLRPFREMNLRVGREGWRSRIVHCYGHGGAGWSMAFGSAAEAVGVVEEVLGSRAVERKKLAVSARL